MYLVLLRPERKAVRDHARSALSLPERAARRGPGAPAVRHQRGRRLRAAHRRGRHRQDHDRALAAGADAEERRDRADPQPAHDGAGVPAHHLRGARHRRARLRDSSSLKDLVDILSHYLLRAHAAGQRVVLVVDEAQNLAPEVLEQVRLLTNLETNTQKLLQIILIGQPELRELLGAQRAAPARAAHHRPLSPGPAVARRDRRLRAAPPARRRRHHRHLHAAARSARCIRLSRRRAARHQRHLRSRAARRLLAGPPPRHRAARAQRRRARCSGGASRPTGCPGR